MNPISAQISFSNAPTFSLSELRVGHVFRNTNTRELFVVVEVLTDDSSIRTPNVREKRLVRCSDFREVTTNEVHRYTWVGELHVGEGL